MNTGQRLLYFIEKHLNSNVARFSISIELTQGALSNLTEKWTPGGRFIHNVLLKYPELNIRWLLLGEGEMLHTQIPSTPAPHALIHQSANYTNGNLSQQAANQDNGWREAIAAKDDLIQMLKAETKRLQTELDNFKNNCAKE